MRYFARRRDQKGTLDACRLPFPRRTHRDGSQVRSCITRVVIRSRAHARVLVNFRFDASVIRVVSARRKIREIPWKNSCLLLFTPPPSPPSALSSTIHSTLLHSRDFCFSSFRSRYSKIFTFLRRSTGDETEFFPSGFSAN